MARTLKTTKKDVSYLLAYLRKVPVGLVKTEDESMKLIGFMGALKKQLKDYLDAESDLRERFTEAQKKNNIRLKELEQVNKDTAKEQLEAEWKPFYDEFVKQEEEIKKMLDLDVEVVFDNEDLNFVRQVFRKPALYVEQRYDKEGKVVNEVNVFEEMEKVCSVLEMAV